VDNRGSNEQLFHKNDTVHAHIVMQEIIKARYTRKIALKSVLSLTGS